MKLLTTRQMAEKLQIAPDTLTRWVREGRVPAVKATRRTLRFDEDKVEKALRKEAVKSGV